MNKQELNKRCAEYIGYSFVGSNGGIAMHAVQMPPYGDPEFIEFDPYSDANDRTKIIAKMIEQGYEFLYFMDDGYHFINYTKQVWDRNEMDIITTKKGQVHADSLDEAEINCIEKVLDNE